MAYEKTIWKNNSEPALDAEHLNKIENGIANSAPGGFGLGEGSKFLTPDDDLNEVWKNGSYAWDAPPKNAPTEGGSLIPYCSMNVLNKGGDYNTHQIIYTFEGYEIHRYYDGAKKTWSEQAWVNPPMLTSVEYRTTERYNGKAVYKMLDADGLVKWRVDGEEVWHYGGGLTYVVGLPMVLTLTGWDPDAQGMTYKLKLVGYKIGANGIQLGLPSDSSVVNTQAVVAAALTIVNTYVLDPVKDKNIAGYTEITISAVNAPSRELTVAIFGLEEAERVTVTESAIEGILVPVAGENPVKTITEGKQFTGAITWEPYTINGKYGPLKSYTATITLTPKMGYKLDGVAANFFTVSGATSVSNGANSGVVTATFPQTSTAVVWDNDLWPVFEPETGETPVLTLKKPSYTGNVVWEPSASTFAASTVYTATVTLTPTEGFTFDGIPENFFKHSGATSVTNAANSGVVTIVFPATK